MNTALPRKRLIAHVLIRDVEGRILLCETQFKPDWELPGGIVEAGEPPRVGAVREVQEELGIELGLGRLMITDWMPPYLGWEDALELIYDGGLIEETDLASLVLQPAEIRRVAPRDPASRPLTWSLRCLGAAWSSPAPWPTQTPPTWRTATGPDRPGETALPHRSGVTKGAQTRTQPKNCRHSSEKTGEGPP